MKNFKNYWACFLMFALVFSSCSKDEDVNVDSDKAVLTLGANLADFKNSDKQSDLPECTGEDPDYALITFSYGDVVRTDVQVDILSDSDGLFTAYHDLLEIPVTSGNTVNVTLHDFKIFAAGGGDPIWVAPKQGSEFASFVSRPVGDDFVINLRAGSKNYTDVEVLCFDDREVNRYGYQFFDIIPTPLQPVCFFANYCPTGPDGRHKVANYSLELFIFEGTPEADPNPEGAGYTEIYGNEVLSPETGLDNGSYYADPLCVAIPILGAGEYLYYEATLEDWPNNYPAGGEGFISGYLSQADIALLLGADEDTVDYEHLFFNCGDTPPPSGDCPAGQDPDGDGICNPNDDCPNTHADDDVDGDCLPDNDDPCPYDPTNSCDDNGVGEGCETAFMVGDYELNDLGLYSNMNWGWGLVLDADEIAADADGVWRIAFHAGAGQNDTDNGWEAGHIVLTLDDDGMLTVEFDLYDDVDLNDSHIWVGDNWPTSRAPGQFDLNDADNIFDVSGLDDIYIIVHAEVCGDEVD